MSNIDKRIVEMQFDNKQFEKGVKDTVSSLSDLKKGLDLSASSKNLADLQTQGNKFSLANIATSVESLSDRFSTFGIIGMTALQNITNSAIDLDKKITSSIMGPLMEGGKERALNIEQARFQFEGLGMDIEATMADASYAVDGTAYSLDAAAKVASQLGASGLRAGEDMRKSLRAVSGVAAMSGSSYEDIGNVFTKVAGQGRLMGDDLLRLSSRGINAAAIIAKELNKTEAEVRDMVTKGKIDFQMFADAMDSAFGEHATAANKTFTGALSNVKSALARIGEKFYTPFNKNLINPLNSLRLVINDLNKALDPAFEALSKFMEVASGNAVKNLENVDFSGLTTSMPMIIEGISNVLKGLYDILKPIGAAWRDVFPAMTGERLVEISTKIKDVTSQFKIGEETANNLKSTFGGLFALLNIGKTIITNLLSVFGKVIGAFLPAGGSVLEFSGNIGEMLMKLDKAIQTSGVFKAMFEGIGTMLTTVAKVIGKAFSVITDAWKQMTGSIDFSWLTVFSKIFETIGKVFSKVGDVIRSAFRNMDAKNFMDIFNAGVLATILLGIRKFINNFKTMFEDGFGFLDGVKALLDGVKGSLEAWQQSLKAKNLLEIASAIAILAGALFLLATIDPTRLASALGAITVLFVELFGAMKVFSMIMKGDGFKSMRKITTAMRGMSTAVLILSFAMKNIASLDAGGVAKSLIGVVTLLGALIGFLWAIPEDKVVKGAFNLVALSTALLIMAQAAKSFASMSWEGLAKAGAGLLGALGMIIGFLWAIPEDKVVKGAFNLVVLSTALLILSKVAQNFAGISWEGLAKAGAGLLGALGMIIGFLWAIPEDKVVKGSVNLVILSTALLLITKVAHNFASMSWEGLAKAGAGMVGALGTIIGFLWALPKETIGKAASLLIISVSLLAISKALTVMGNMSWDNIKKAGVVLAGSLAMIAGAMYLMTEALPGAGALLMVAAALAVLTPVLLAFGAMPLDMIGKSLLMLAGIFTIFVVSALVLSTISVPLLAIGGALLMMGGAAVLAGVGMLALGAGITALAAAFAASGGAIFAVLEGLIGLIPTILGKIGEGIVALATAIGNGAAAIIEAVTKILAGIFQAIIDSAPKFFESVTVLLVGICQLIIDTAPKFIEAIFVVLTALLDELIEFIPKFVDASMKIMTGILTGIAENIPDIAKAGTDVVIAFIRAIGTETPRIIDAGFKMMIDFINGLADSIRENTPELIVAGQNLAAALLRAIADVLTGGIFGFSQKGKESGEAYEGGIAGKIKDIRDKAGEAAGKALEGLKSKSKEMYNVGVDCVTGFINGLGSKLKNVWDKAWELGTTAITAATTALDINSPSKEFIKIGQSIGEGLTIGIDNSIGDPVQAISNMMDEIMNIASGDFEKFEKWMSDRKYFDKSSLVEELIAWEEIQNATWRSAEEREKAAKEVYRIQNELIKKSYQHSMNWIAEQKKHNNLSLEDEYAAYERINDNLGQYIELLKESGYTEAQISKQITELVKANDEEKYRVRNELIDAAYQNSMDWIERETNFERMSLTDKLAAYTRVGNNLNDYADELRALGATEMEIEQKLGARRKKTELEVYRLQKEIYEASKKYEEDRTRLAEERAKERLSIEKEYSDKKTEIIEEFNRKIDDADAKYDDALKSRTDSLYGSYGLFDEVAKKNKVSGSTLMKNLQAQVDEFSDWEEQLNSLSAKGVNKGLIDELQKMGPSAIAEIKALNSMSDSELAQYATLWATKHKEAKDRAIDELKDLRTEANSEIVSLESDLSEALDDLYDDYYGKNGKFDKFDNETTKRLSTLRENFANALGLVKDDSEEIMTDMITISKGVLGAAGFDEDGFKLGSDLMTGVNNGLESKLSGVLKTIETVMQKIVNKAKEVPEVESPSKVFAKIGQYLVEGLVVGIKERTNEAIDASGALGRNVIRTMSASISKISEVANSDMDIAPTIRPVMDMTDFRSGINYMNTALTADRSMLLGATAANQNGTNSYIDELASKLSDANTQSNNKITSAIEGLKSDFTGLVDKVTKLQVVMDTGTLVGAIGPDMDRELGGLSNMTRRGVR